MEFSFVLFLISAWDQCVKSPKDISGYSVCLEELWIQLVFDGTTH